MSRMKHKYLTGKGFPSRGLKLARWRGPILLAVFATMFSPILLLHAAPDRQGAEIVLRIVEEETKLGEVTAAAGDEVSMEIVVDGAQDLRGMEFKLLFDSSVAVIGTDGVDTEGAPPGFLVLTNSDQPGVLVIALAGSDPAGVDSFRLATVTFNLVGEPAQTTGLSFAEVQAGDNSVPVKSIPVELIGGSLSIESADGATEESVTVLPSETGVSPAPSPSTAGPGLDESPTPAGQPATETASPPGSGCNPGSSPRNTWDGGWLLLGLLLPGLVFRRWRGSGH